MPRASWISSLHLTYPSIKYEPEPDSDEDSDLDEEVEEEHDDDEDEYDETSISSRKRRSLGEGDRTPSKRRKVEVSSWVTCTPSIIHVFVAT